MTASKYLSKFTAPSPQSADWSSRDHGLQVRHQTLCISAFKCISVLTESWAPSANLSSLNEGLYSKSPKLLNYSLHVYLTACPISTLKYNSIITQLWPPRTSLHQQTIFQSLEASGAVWKLLDQNPRMVTSWSWLDLWSHLQVHLGVLVTNLGVQQGWCSRLQMFLGALATNLRANSRTSNNHRSTCQCQQPGRE